MILIIFENTLFEKVQSSGKDAGKGGLLSLKCNLFKKVQFGQTKKKF